MTDERRLLAAGDDVGERLDSALARHLDDLSRSAVADLIRAGRVTVDGAVVTRCATRLGGGERIAIVVPPPPRAELEAEDIPLSILYQDEDLVVVDKPAGMVVHPAHGHDHGTLVNALLGGPLAPPPEDEPRKPGVVHRLDRDTSGCIVIARTAMARAGLEAQFKAREVGKTYLAVVHGQPSASGRIEAAIGRHPRDRKRMSTRTRSGKVAISSFRVRERFSRACLLEVEIATGRTHQIRVHLASIGHPVVGDAVYGRGRSGVPVLDGFPRQALHAAVLRLRHPRTGATLVFRAPLPIDLRELLEALRGSTETP